MQGLINMVSDPVVLTLKAIDLLTVLLVVYLFLAITSDRRTLLMIRGFVVILFLNIISSRSGLQLLTFVLDKLLIGAAVSMAVLLQTELRRFLEQLGRGNVVGLLKPSRRSPIKTDSIIEKLHEAVQELSQNRTGALILIETGEPIEEHEFSVSGVTLNAFLSKEILQTIFQPSTLLHDGAVWVREERIIAAGVIFPISDRYASREIGTRHRAAMGITERVNNCFCIVVSEETGSIAIADQGSLDRPITSSKLKETLELKLASKRPVTLAGKPRFNNLRQILGWESIFKRKSSRKNDR